MRIVINHLTRMRRGYICVAGIDLATGQRIRPMPRGADLRYPDLAAHGGLFEIGAVIDIGYAKPKGQPPESEDREFLRRYARRLDDIEPAKLWQLMMAEAKPTLIEIFGSDLKPIGHEHAAVEPGHGQVSLGTLAVTQHRPELFIEHHTPRDRIRLKLRTGKIPLNLSVTDIRLYEPDHVTPDAAAVAVAQERLHSSAEVLLGVGLTRAYADWLSNQPPLHWLQVNNLHFVEEPIRRLPEGPLPPLV